MCGCVCVPCVSRLDSTLLIESGREPLSQNSSRDVRETHTDRQTEREREKEKVSKTSTLTA